MDTATFTLDPPRFEEGRGLLIAGLRGTFTAENWAGIPALWQRLAAFGPIPGLGGTVRYGLCFPKRAGLDYLCGAELEGTADLPIGFSTAHIPAQLYAVFAHRGHVSQLRQTLDAIQEWLGGSGLTEVQPAPGEPSFFERYGEKFDPRTLMGDIEVWVPIQRREGGQHE